jgi:carboxymethylenebutenolidase
MRRGFERKRLLKCCFAVSFSLSILALWTTAASPGRPRSQVVRYKSGEQQVAAYLALPSATGRRPAIILVHDQWGQTEWIREQARRLAGEDFVALAVDLYGGKTTTNAIEADGLMNQVQQGRGAVELEAAFNYLATRPDVNRSEIGSVGWSTGATLALELAARERIAACILNYGPLPKNRPYITRIHVPMMGNFGADDPGVSQDALRVFKRAIHSKSKKQEIDFKIYEGAGVDFENYDDPSAFRKESAEDAFTRMLSFFRRHLAGAA